MLTLLLATTSVVAKDCGESNDPCGTQIQWSQFESIHLQSGQVGERPGLTAYLRVARDSGDFQIDVDIADANQPQHGTIMMVAGRVMVSTGHTVPRKSSSATDRSQIILPAREAERSLALSMPRQTG